MKNHIYKTLFSTLAFFLLHTAAKSQPTSCTPVPTGENATIVIPQGAQLTLDGTALPEGSYIFAMFSNNGVLTCAGFIAWNGSAAAMTVYGADGGNPGYAVGEEYKFRIELPGGCVISGVEATYVIGGIYSNTNTYANDGLSGIATLQASSMQIDAAGANPFCSGSADGSASVTFLVHGVAPYDYAWSNGQSTPLASGLSPGNYSVTVTDSLGCTDTDAFSLQKPSAIIINMIAMPETNSAGNGSATAQVSGGTPPYSYLWNNNPPGTAANIIGLSAGAYSITVTDSQGCTETGTVTVINDILNVPCTIWVGPSPSSAYSVFNDDFGGAPCDDGSGCPFNEYTGWEVWASEAYTVDNFQEGGTYAFSICNGAGAGTWIPDFTIIAPSGAIDAFGLGDGDGCTITWTASENGIYLIIINEAGHCGSGNNIETNNGYPALTCIGNAFCTEPCLFSNLTIASLTDNGDGTATANVFGGTPPYSYSWSNGQTAPIATGLITGEYFITVTDASGCTTTGSLDVLFTSIEEVNINNDFFIMPNPAYDEVAVVIKSTFLEGTLKVCDLKGQIVKHKILDPLAQQAILDVSNWPTGLYIIWMQLDGEGFFRKLVIDRR